jgi:hypothetical protein
MTIIKKNGTKGSAVIIMAATVAVLGVIGYILGSLISRHQQSIPTNMDSARAFVLAQSGVEYVGKFLEGKNFTTVANPPTLTLGTGTFSSNLSGATATQIDATVTGISGTATRRITVRFQKKGGAVLSRNAINVGNNPNGTVVCDATTNCNTNTIHTCVCTRENVPASVIPNIPVPSPAPPVVPPAGGGCDVANHTTATIPAGVYYCPTYRIRNNSTLSLGGAVTIFCDSFTIETLSNFNMTGQAGNLTIIASNGVNIENNVNLKGAIYAPEAGVTMGMSATITGMLVGNLVGLNNNFTVNLDPTAGSNTPYFPTLAALDEVIDWREL